MTERKRTYIERVVLAVLAFIVGLFAAPVPKQSAIRSFATSQNDASYAGLPISGAGLARWHVSYRQDLDIRFRADANGSLRSISAFICQGNGYAAGHGGTLQLDVYADNGSGLPGGSSLGSFTRTNPLQPGSSPAGKWANTSEVGYAGGNFFGELTLTPQPTVVAGAVYHAVFTNPTGDGANWYCVDALATRYKGGNRQSQNLSLLPSMDWGGLYRARPKAVGDGGTDTVNYTDNAWRDGTGNTDASGNPYFNSFVMTPIASVNYTSGHNLGFGTVFTPLGYNPLQTPVSSAGQRQRQTFPAGVIKTGTIAGAGLTVIPIGAAGTARVNLRRLDDDTLLSSADVNYSLPPAMLPIGSPYCHFSSNPEPVDGSLNWDYPGYGNPSPATCDNNGVPVEVTFSSPPSVSSSVGYYLEFTCPPSVNCNYAVQGGSKVNGGAGYGYGFGPETQQSGEWERNTGSGWNNGGDKQSFSYVKYSLPGGTTTTAAPTTTIATTTTTAAPSSETIYPSQPTPPAFIALGSGYPVETAQRVNVTCNGQVSGVRWYRSASDSGTNTASVWRSGVLIASKAADPGTTGWSTLTFTSPVSVTAGDVLIVGVHRPNGAYGSSVGGFNSRSVSSTSGCLVSPATTGGALNGLYAYTASPALPTLSYDASEYFISPVFTPTAAPTTTAATTTTAAATTTTTAAPTTTTTLAPGSLVWSDEFSSINFTQAGVTRAWAQNDPTWQNVERGYIDFAGPGSWNANRYEQLATSTGGTAVLDPFSVSAGVLSISNAALPSNVAASVRALADAQGQSGVATPTRYGGYMVTNRNFTNPTTGGPLEFKGGFFELKARFPDFGSNGARGLFPAWWLYASRGSDNPDDKGQAEIDIFEMFGKALGSPFSRTLHFKDNAGADVFPSETVGSSSIDPTQWHTYGFDWRLTTDAGGAVLRWYIDGTLVQTVTTNAGWYDTPMSMRINMASDAAWFPAGDKTAGDTANPARFDVDYVRVYNTPPSASITPVTTTTTTSTTTTSTTSTTTTTLPGATTTTTTSTTTTTLPPAACAPLAGWAMTPQAAPGAGGTSLVDGSQATAWVGSTTMPQVLTFKLSQQRSISNVQIQWAPNRASTAFLVEARTATGSYRIVGIQTGYRSKPATCWEKRLIGAPVAASYIRVTLLDREPAAGSSPVSIKEIAVK